VSRLYFDWNSTTPPLADAVKAMVEVYARAWGNPSSVHAEGRGARARLEEARVAVAGLVSGSPYDVVFTSGGTEASNLALLSPYARDPGGAFLYAPIEHASVGAVATRLAEQGVDVRKARVHRSGLVDLDDVERKLQLGGVRAVAIQAVNGETGVVQPVAEVSALAHAKGAVVHVDAIQGLGRIAPPGGSWLACADTIAIAAHKIQGPKGIGAVVSRPGHPLHPVLRGGSQERGLRPGTQDPALASGFAVAADRARHSRAEYEAVAQVRDRLESGLRARGAGINGEGAPRVGHVVHASFRGWSSPELVAALDLEGLACSGGAACHAGVPEPSATLVAMYGDHPEDHWRYAGPVRFSLPPWTTESQVDQALAVLDRVLARAGA
jgi:cysteine desulfurase